jgi:hypothetical protein
MLHADSSRVPREAAGRPVTGQPVRACEGRRGDLLAYQGRELAMAFTSALAHNSTMAN